VTERPPQSAGRATLWLAATAPAALAAGGAWAGLTGEPLGWVALALGVAAGAGLHGMARQTAGVPPPAELLVDDLLLRLIDELPVTVWLEDWTPVRSLMERARRECGGDLGAWLDAHPEERRRAADAATVLHSNEAGLQLYGASSREQLHEPGFDSMLTRESGERVAAVLEPLLDGARSIVFDSIDQRVLDGSRRSLRTALVVPEGHGARWDRVLLVETDISEEVEANRRLMASEASMRELLEQLPMALWLEDWSALKPLVERAFADSEGDLEPWLAAHPEAFVEASEAMEVIYVNRAAVELYGASSVEELRERDLGSLTEPRRAGVIAEQLLKLLGGERQTMFDLVELERFDGKSMSLRGAIVLMPGHEHDWSRVLMVEFDITEQVRAERQQAESWKRYREIFESSPLGIWENDWSAIKRRVDELRLDGVTDLKAHLKADRELAREIANSMVLRDVNAAAMAIYRLPDRQALLRGDIVVPLSDDEVDAVVEMIDGFVAGGHLVSHEAMAATFDDAEVAIRISGSLQDDRRADWSRVVMIVQDITIERAVMARIRQSEQRYRELFEQSPLAIWEGDWSPVKREVERLHAEGVDDLRAYFKGRPEEAAALENQIVITDVNTAAVKLYAVPDRQALLDGNLLVPGTADELDNFIEVLGSLDAGNYLVTRDIEEVTFHGEHLIARNTFHVPEAHRANWDRVVLHAEDITLRQQAVARIEESERRYRELFEQSPLAIWENDWSRVKAEVDRLRAAGVTDLAAYLDDHPEEARDLEDQVRVIDVNAAAIKLYGIPDRDALLAGEMQVPSSDDEHRAFLEVVAALDRGEYLVTRDIMETTFGGGLLIVRNTFHVPEAHRGGWDRVVLLAEDITLRREAQARIEESERKYRELFAQSPFAIWESDWSEVKRRIDAIGEEWADPIARLRTQPALAAEINELIVAVDMNDAALRLFGVDSADDIRSGRERVAATRDEIDSLVDIAAGFLAGQSVVVREIVEETFDHRVIVIRATTMIPDAARGDWKRVVSFIEDITEQQEAQARIEASERRYRELFDQAPVGIRVDDWSHVRRRAERLFLAEGGRLADHLIANRAELWALCADLRVVEANEGCLRIYGAANLEDLRRQCQSELSDDMLDELARTLEQLVQGASSVSRGETAERLAGGGLIFTRGTVLIPEEYHRDWARVILTVEDVTEIRRTREAMVTNERRYRELFDQSPVAIQVENWSRVKARLDALGPGALARLDDTPGLLESLYDDMELVDVNEMGWRQRHAANRDEIIAWSRTPLPESEREVCRMLLQGLLAGRRRIILPDAQQHRLDGTTYMERGVTFVPPEFTRDWRRVIHVLEDVTAEHEALRSLDESRSMMALAQRMTRHGHFVFDADVGRVIVASDTIGQMFGVPVERFATSHAASFELIHPDDRERVSAYLVETAGNRLPTDVEYRVLWPNGEVRYLHEQAEFMVDDRGRPINRRIGAIHDVTEERRTAEALRSARDDAERASRAKTEFLATISHELRTPLNAIIGFSEVILEGMFGPLENPRYSEYVRDINESGRHLLELINDILDLAKAEAGRLQLNEDIVNLRTVVEQSTKLFRERADRSGVTLIATTPRHLPRLKADTRKLRQVLLNLVSNAVKFTPDHGRIEVSAELREDGGVDIVVADTGIGMTGADMARAFEVFGQVDSALNRRYEGTGLGLPLARAVLQLHDGELIMDSVLGKGTRVVARFPAWRSMRERSSHNAV